MSGEVDAEKHRVENGVTPEKEAGSGGLKSLATHFGIIAVILPIFVAGLRILLVSEGDPAVILAIASTLNVKTALLSAILPLMSTLAFPSLLFAAFATHALGSFRVSEKGKWATYKIAFSGLALTVLPITSLTSIISGIVGVLVLWLYVRRERRRLHIATSTLARIKKVIEDKDATLEDKVREIQSIESVEVYFQKIDKAAKRSLGPLLAFGFVYLLASILISRYWLPAEVIKVKGQPEVVVSVLDSANNELLMLQVSTTRVVRVRQSDVEFRQVCDIRNRNFWLVPIVYQMSRGPKTPTCP